METLLRETIETLASDPRVRIAFVVDGAGRVVAVAGEAEGADMQWLAHVATPELEARLGGLLREGSGYVRSALEPETGCVIHLLLVARRLALIAFVEGSTPADAIALDRFGARLEEALAADPEAAERYPVIGPELLLDA